MKTEELRDKFLTYFKEKGHRLVPSSAVFPHDDPTILFTNAGMNQFKDVFLGQTTRDYKRASTSQKCIRVGGKHNDLENVGHTSRHLTFFEMLGNFSFGDYFKKEAIQFAFEVATEVFGFEKSRIWPTVFTTDDEAFEIWKNYVPEERITRFGEKENFWSMGETGPCGPCSELLYDRGEKYGSCKNPSEDTTGERFLEFWNLVFMQYNKTADGKLEPLPKPSIDTGAGLERVVALTCDVDNVFETDVLMALILEVEKISGIKYEKSDLKLAPAFHVIADHMRSLSFAIADGVQPSNVDRGYVLRKILRRAVKYGRQLNLQKPFLAKLIPCLIEKMGKQYPELQKGQKRIAEILTVEEEAFIKTLERGGNLLNQMIESATSHQNKITGDDAFKLKDTYGFPLEEILLIAKDANLTVDLDRFLKLEEEAKTRSKSSSKNINQVASQSLFTEFFEKFGATKFLGFELAETQGKILKMIVNEESVNEMQEGEKGLILLDQTVFYGEMGGQVGDRGELFTSSSLFEVEDCKFPYKGLTGHFGSLKKGALKVGMEVTAKIDHGRRKKIQNNHTATHLLHYALHHILGESVKQAGSVVDETRLRFDFSYHKSLVKEEIEAIEDLVNSKIRENAAVKTYEISYEEAVKKQEIKQFFGDKYGDKVRVVDIDFSKELCGGTHTASTGSIGYFRIAKESSIAAGIRRIEAVTGREAELLARESDRLIDTFSKELKTTPLKLEERIHKLLLENKEMSQEIKKFRKQELSKIIASCQETIKEINGNTFIEKRVNLSQEELREVADEVMNRFKPAILSLSSLHLDQCFFLIRLSDEAVKKGKNGAEMIKTIAKIIEGNGGGRPNHAQATGKAKERINEAENIIRELVSQ